MTFIKPLELQTWLVSVFSGTPEIFTAISLLVITIMAGYFRMRGIGLFFMLGLFVLLFSEVIPFSLLNFLLIFVGLTIGYIVANFTQK